LKHFIKICGITSVEDAEAVHLAGADAIGLMMYKNSSRYLELNQAKKIYDSINKRLQVVLIFVDQTEDYVGECIELMPNSISQFHGSETPKYCNSFKNDFIKAINVKEEFNLEDAYKKFLGVKILLLDSFSAEKYGGTGDTFNWELIQNSQQLPFILAGGLNPDNIELALSRVSCTGVDASSGVESHPGKKDLFKVESFIKKVREVHD
tara:strand:- start:587 stop:1210 length:624 start_codon:yes stop_codon:yes gene_type:complete